MKRLHNILIAILLASAMSAWAGNVVVKANLDSATLLMGRVTALHIELSQDQGTVGRWAFEGRDTLLREVEIAAALDADTSNLGNGRELIKRDIILQAFDSGLYVLPPVQYIVDTDTFTSTSPLSLKVIPVNVDSLTDVHPIKPVAVPEYKWYDWMPVWMVRHWWLIALALLLIAGIAFAIYRKRKHGTIIPKRVKRRLPPAEEALAALTTLKPRIPMLEDKQYYTELTDILRVYIDRRFGINAVEMTSSQIKRQLRQRGETRAVDEQLDLILEVADFVKFAGQRSLPGDNEAAWQRAVNFVEVTRPAPDPTNTTGDKEGAPRQ